MSPKLTIFAESIVRRVLVIFLLSMLGFVGYLSVLFVVGDTESLQVILSTLNANISEAVKNLVDLDLQALFAKWMEGLYSIVLLAALGFPFLLFKYLSKEKTQ